MEQQKQTKQINKSFESSKAKVNSNQKTTQSEKEDNASVDFLTDFDEEMMLKNEITYVQNFYQHVEVGFCQFLRDFKVVYFVFIANFKIRVLIKHDFSDKYSKLNDKPIMIDSTGKYYNICQDKINRKYNLKTISVKNKLFKYKQLQQVVKQIAYCKLLNLFGVGPEFKKTIGCDLIIYEDHFCYLTEICSCLESTFHQLQGQQRQQKFKQMQFEIAKALNFLRKYQIPHKPISKHNITFSSNDNKFKLIDLMNFPVSKEKINVTGYQQSLLQLMKNIKFDLISYPYIELKRRKNIVCFNGQKNYFDNNLTKQTLYIMTYIFIRNVYPYGNHTLQIENILNNKIRKEHYQVHSQILKEMRKNSPLQQIYLENLKKMQIINLQNQFFMSRSKFLQLQHILIEIMLKNQLYEQKQLCLCLKYVGLIFSNAVHKEMVSQYLSSLKSIFKEQIVLDFLKLFQITNSQFVKYQDCLKQYSIFMENYSLDNNVIFFSQIISTHLSFKGIQSNQPMNTFQVKDLANFKQLNNLKYKAIQIHKQNLKLKGKLLETLTFYLNILKILVSFNITDTQILLRLIDEAQQIFKQLLKNRTFLLPSIFYANILLLKTTFSQNKYSNQQLKEMNNLVIKISQRYFGNPNILSAQAHLNLSEISIKMNQLQKANEFRNIAYSQSIHKLTIFQILRQINLCSNDTSPYSQELLEFFNHLKSRKYEITQSIIDKTKIFLNKSSKKYNQIITQNFYFLIKIHHLLKIRSNFSLSKLKQNEEI